MRVHVADPFLSGNAYRDPCPAVFQRSDAPQGPQRHARAAASCSSLGSSSATTTVQFLSVLGPRSRADPSWWSVAAKTRLPYLARQT
ncbi:uncharacterized protein IUM83_12211 [Phytophthora cinnamomi]|uniref:uncharacterized protein n=1 Tax=Phytophthora cinnamomi TaxID=4785 RepID=UPI00355A7C51|nr:hypothetical protein IUM83_12211 [Phytophthora cinnamomi]